MEEKQLIIHMDDIGLSYAANQAAKELFQNGVATSASIMIPCSWAYDFIKWSIQHPEYDVGLHSTLTSEWDAVKWRPIYNKRDLPSMITSEGFMVSGLQGEMASISTEDFEAEVVAQIEAAIELGYRPSHLDNHMFVFIHNTATFRKYLEIAGRYNLYPHISAFSTFDTERKDIVRNSGFIQIKGDYAGAYGSKEGLFEQFEKMEKGLNVLTVHPVIDTPEIRAMIPNYKERVLEYELLMDKETKAKIEQCGIRLISWKDVQQQERDRKRN